MNKSTIVDAMLIALDFDGTFTADPPFWRAFVLNCLVASHQVVIVSCRLETEENFAIINDALQPLSLPVYLTSLRPKADFVENRSISVDVWIDDTPESVADGR